MIMRLLALCLVVTLSPGAALQTATVELPLHIGVGCNHSDYATLSAGDSPAFSITFDNGFGLGLYVLHMAHFHLPRDDAVVLRAKDGDGTQLIVLSGRNTTGEFFTKPVAGDGVVIELIKAKNVDGNTEDKPTNEEECFGFGIDGIRFTPQSEAASVAIGDESAVAALAVAAANATGSRDKKEVNESLCGEDESQEAVCYASGATPGGAAMYAASKPVARLVIRKDSTFNIAYCTGFLLGCEGHLLTNQHCIRDWIDALNTGVEFFAEASQCGSDVCRQRAACPGRIRVRSVSLVAVSTQYDYALVKLTPDDGSSPSSLLGQVGGYLQLRGSGPRLDEQIFIPQYPMGYGKRIASTASGAPGRIESLSVGTCGGKDIGYYVDTQEGSSGSPIMATSDNLVVGIHHCGGCLNGAIPSTALINDMQQKGVLPRCAVA